MDCVACTGLPEADEWTFYGDDLDHTLGMRNTLGYAAARVMGELQGPDLARPRVPRWAPRHAAFELFLVQVIQ